LEIPIQNEIKNNKVVDKKHDNYSGISKDLEKLDNSSFSLEERISDNELL